MKNIFTTLLLLGAFHLAHAEPLDTTYAGGDGSSTDKAIVIKATTDSAGVGAEYDYIKKHFPGYKLTRQTMVNAKDHAFDMMEFTTSTGETKTLYFDITAFFGK